MKKEVFKSYTVVNGKSEAYVDDKQSKLDPINTLDLIGFQIANWDGKKTNVVDNELNGNLLFTIDPSQKKIIFTEKGWEELIKRYNFGHRIFL